MLSSHYYISSVTERNVPTMIAYDKEGLKITFTLEKIRDSNTLVINVNATNNTLSNMTDFLFQVAVPKVGIQNSLSVSVILIRHILFGQI